MEDGVARRRPGREVDNNTVAITGGKVTGDVYGTASADGSLRAVLAEISGGHVEYDSLGRVKQVVDGSIRFGAGGLLSTPLGKGLYDGRPKGNPRYKGLLEGFHGLIKNELGDVRGHVGGGRGLEPETVYGMDKRDEQLRAIASALERERPGISGRLQMPYIPYYDFKRLVDLCYERPDASCVVSWLDNIIL